MIKAKVIHIITKMELGGAQQNTLFTISHLNSEKYLPFIIAGPDGELLDEALSSASVFIVSDLTRKISPLHDIRALFKLKQFLKKIKRIHPSDAPLIVHTHSSKAGILGRWAARFASIPVIIHSIHGFGFNSFQPFWLRKAFILAEKLTASITTKFIAVSQANINTGISLGIFSAEKTVCIRSGINIEEFRLPLTSRENMRKQLGLPISSPVAAMIACFKQQKAPIDFIHICDRVIQAVPDAQFIMVGDGELRQQVEHEIKRRTLHHVIHLLGWRRDIPDILHSIDVLILTSLWEGLPRVFPQAMAAGIPIVATKVDGASEAVHEGVNGFLLPPHDIEGMAQKIILLLRNPVLARTMGEKGCSLVEEFDGYNMVKQQEMLYDELLAATCLLH